MSNKPFSRLVNILAGREAEAEGGGLLLGNSFSRLEKFVHFWALVWRSFVRNRCPARASALSYTTLLALIPLLAVVVSVTSSLLKSEGEQQIDGFIQKLVDSVTPPTELSTNSLSQTTGGAFATNWPGTAVSSLAGDERVVEARKTVARYINGFIQNTRSGALGVTGTVLLLFVVVSLLGSIEETMNDIWGVTRGRNWLARLEHYWFAIGLGPTLLIAGLALATGPRFAGVRHFVEAMPFVGGLIFKILPLVFLWLAFTCFYELMPNTKVHWRAAAVGGLAGSLLWLGNNAVGFLYVSRVVSNSKIYGSLGLVLVFMAGLYFSWFILLLGAQIAYAWQNRVAYLQDKLAENVNQRGREFVALRLMTCIGGRFQGGLPPATIQNLTAELGIPSRLIQQVLHPLLAARLVTEIAGAEPAYAPARPLEAINAHHVLLALRAASGQDLVTPENVRSEIYGEFARIQEAEQRAASSVTMFALVNRAQARLELAPPDDRKADSTNNKGLDFPP